MTGTSTLDPDNFPEAPDRSLGKGHGVDALGPSDISDTGSDVVGGPGFAANLDDDQKIDLDTGTTSDNEASYAHDSAGADLGDPNFESDSDFGGTGERAAAGRDLRARDGRDIGTDHIESIPDLPLTDEQEISIIEDQRPTIELAKHPGIQFHLGVHAPAEATRRILHGDADIGLTMSRTPENGIQVEHLQPSPVLAVMRRGHPLTRFKQLALSQLLAYPIALPEPDTTVRQLFDIACSRQRLNVEPVLTSNYVSSLFGFLRHCPEGVTISGEISIRYQVDRRELAFVRLRDRGLDLRNMEVQTLVGRTLSSAAQAFLEFLKERLAPGLPQNQ